MGEIRNIVVTPYNPEWPRWFEREAAKIREVLGDNCLEVLHVGSTAVPGLSAKPKIDIIPVVRNIQKTINALEKIGYVYRGEYNIPMHYGFSKRGDIEFNLHVYTEGHPEIELNLLFRDYLRKHPETRDAYGRLKEALLKDSASFEKKNSLLTGYNLGKDAFIHKVLKATHFSRIRITHCFHYAELEAAKKFRQDYFSSFAMTDPDGGTFDQKDHVHFILYQGVDMIGYAHIQLRPAHRATLRIFALDAPHRHQKSQFLQLCEQWLKNQGFHLHEELDPRD